MDFPKLKMPDSAKPLSMQSSALLGSLPDSFPQAFESAMEEGAQGPFSVYQYSVSVADYDWTADIAKKICDEMNRRERDLRGFIDGRMEEYLLTHDGFIGAWPDSQAGGNIFFENLPDVKFPFDYFGDKYEYRNGGVRRKTDGFVYHNEYQFQNTIEYNDLLWEERALRTETENSAKRVNGLYTAAAAVGLFVCGFALLSILADMLFGFGDTLLALATALRTAPGQTAVQKLLHGVVTVLWIPAFLHSLIALASGAVYWVLVIILLGFCVGGLLFCLRSFREYHGYAVRAKKARRALEEFRKTERYVRIAAENEAAKRQAEAMAEEWHRAWYAWICTAKDAPAGAEKQKTDRAGDKAL